MPTKRELKRELDRLGGPTGRDKRDLPVQSLAHVLSNYPTEKVPGRDDVVLIDGELHRSLNDWFRERAERKRQRAALEDTAE
jgi:hypothetical protein